MPPTPTCVCLCIGHTVGGHLGSERRVWWRWPHGVLMPSCLLPPGPSAPTGQGPSSVPVPLLGQLVRACLQEGRVSVAGLLSAVAFLRGAGPSAASDCV